MNDLNRKEFVSVAAKTFLGVSAAPLLAKAQKMPTAKNVIYLYMNGGMTHLDTFDPKPGAETQGDTKAIRTNVDNIIISENFPKLAYVMDKIALINKVYKDFQKFDSFKRDRKLNKNEYVKVNDGSFAPAPNTWIWCQKDVKPELLELRKTILTKFVEDHIDNWINTNVFKRLDRDEVTDVRKRQVILDSEKDIYSGFGETLNEYVDDISVDHLEQFGRGGSNEPENLAGTTSFSNSARVK